MSKIIITKEQLKKLKNTLSEDNKSITEDKDGNYMAKQQLFTIATLAYKMWELLEEGEELEDWMESKIAQCDQSITSVVKSFMYDEVSEKQKGTETSVNYDDLIIGT